MTDSLSGTASFRFSEIPCPKKEKKKIAIEEDSLHTCAYMHIYIHSHKHPEQNSYYQIWASFPIFWVEKHS